MQVPTLPTPSIDRPFTAARTVGILSTYPPTPCGLATFSAALASGLVAKGAEVRVVRVADGSKASSPQVIGELVSGSPRSIAETVTSLDRCDVAVVQHEYGLYDGADGGEVVDVIEGVDDPDALARALHRVLTEPGLAAGMAAEAARLAPTMGWPVVAEAYLTLADLLVSERAALV